MKLIAQKPCSFGGKRFYIGDEIPLEFVVNPESQSKLGVLAIYNDGPHKDFTEAEEVMSFKGIKNQKHLTIPIVTENGTEALSVAQESIITALEIMQTDVKEAEKAIEHLADENALIILHACDSRKGIKNASEKRALALQVHGEIPSDEIEDMEKSEGDA